MLERIKRAGKLILSCVSHRLAYAGVAGAYFGEITGLVPKDVSVQIIIACYVMLILHG